MPSSSQLRLLLVDDNELCRALLSVILRGDEYVIVGEADSAEEALALCPRVRPDVVLLDIMLPGMPGLEAIAPIKALLPQVRILMVSGSDDADNVTEAIREGADGFVVKPFNTASVQNTMRRMRDEFILSAPVSLPGLS